MIPDEYNYGTPDCDMNATSIIKMYEDSFFRHWDLLAMSDYKGATWSYRDLATHIAKFHIVLEKSGIKPGDKVALCGKNCSAWGASYFSLLTYGAVPVPILNDFKPWNIHAIVNHSEAKLLFVGQNVWNNLKAEEMPAIIGAVVMDNFVCAFSRDDKFADAMKNVEANFAAAYPEGFKKTDIHYNAEKDTNDMAVLNYTSGTTSDPKGVMIPYRALLINCQFACSVISLQHEHKVVSILPMAHMFGLAFQLMFELLLGSSVCYLVKMPSPAVIFQAFAEVHPKVVIAVPLIIEKVIKQKVMPIMNKPMIRFAMKVPVIKNRIAAKINRSIVNAFGGEMDQLIVGGAALNADVEKVLRKIKFHYTVGYGTTECAPLIAYSGWFEYKAGSCGKFIPGTEVDIFSEDKTKEIGEILVKGPNVMLGYFKNPNATREVIDPQGWYHTGDMGIIDKDGVITIKGRCKNMILGPSGQNIYPEEIEDQMVNLPYIEEVLVVSRQNKLVALILPDYEAGKADGLNEEQVRNKMEENRKTLNQMMPAYSQVAEVEIRTEPFERTPKKSIRRFLYT